MSRTSRSVSRASTIQSTAYATRAIWMISSTRLFVTTVRKNGRHTTATSTARTAITHMTRVAPRPSFARRRLPAAACAEPGIRRFTTTSHQARRVMTAGDVLSG
jgi:hypothetical protein